MAPAEGAAAAGSRPAAAAADPAVPAGGPGASGGRQGRGPQPTRSVLNASVGYRQSSSSSSSTFPTIGGSAGTAGLNVPVSWMLTKGRINNVLTVTYNRNSSTSTNLYAYNTNVVGAAGIEGVSSDPFDWGIPGLSFTTVADLRDRTPSRRVDQRIQISNSTMRTLGPSCGQVGRRVPLPAARQPVEQQPARKLRLHRSVHVGAGERPRRPRHRPRPRGFSARIRAAGVGAVRARRLEDAGPRLEPLPSGRLARARQPHAQLRAALRVRLAVLRGEQPPRQPRRELGLHRRRAGRGRRDRRSSPARCRRASSRRIATTLRRGSAWRGGRSRA